MTNGLSRETHHHLLLILILILFFLNFLFLPFNRLETRLYLLKNSKSIIALILLINIFIIYSIVLRCLLATLGFDRKLGLETANFVFTIAKIVSFSIAAKKNAPKNADTE